MAKVYHDIVQRAIQLHGSLGASNETPLARMWSLVPSLALADGPTEVHKVQVAKAALKAARPTNALFGSDHNVTRLEEAKRRYAAILDTAEFA